MTVRVVTDSSAVMPPSWSQRLPLEIEPLQMAWADGSTDPGTLPYGQLAERLAAGEDPPTTSAPSPGAYQALFERVLADGASVLVVCPPTELSTTYANATLAARQLSSPQLRVLDARTAAAGQGLVAAAAAEVGAGGGDLQAALDRALEVASKVQIWATLAQLEFLRRSGRVPAIAAVGAGALRLQPIVRYAGGSPSPVGVTRSSIRAADRLFRAFERTPTTHTGVLIAFHSARGEEAADLVRRVRERAPGATAEAVEVTSSLAAHTGPGLLGLAWFWDN